jgi:hypothetical protein
MTKYIVNPKLVDIPNTEHPSCSTDIDGSRSNSLKKTKLKKCCPICFERMGFNYFKEKDMFDGNYEYFLCRNCQKQISTYQLTKFQELLNIESTHHIKVIRQQIQDFKCQLREILSEGYVNSKVVLKIENLLEKI